MELVRFFFFLDAARFCAALKQMSFQNEKNFATDAITVEAEFFAGFASLA